MPVPKEIIRESSAHALFVHGLRLVAGPVLLAGAFGIGTQAQLLAPAKGLPTLTHADQIRRLSPEQASLGYPVLVRGVITMDAPAPGFIVQDETAGIYVEGSISPKFPHLLGQLVELDGITGPANSHP
jgi:hypothetical protein